MATFADKKCGWLHMRSCNKHADEQIITLAVFDYYFFDVMIRQSLYKKNERERQGIQKARLIFCAAGSFIESDPGYFAGLTASPLPLHHQAMC
jgi:hypothetical protein